MMAVGGIGNLGQHFTEPLPGQAQSPPAGPGNPGHIAATEDTFTPSAQSNFAQDAGIFQINLGALTALRINPQLGQPTPDTAQIGFPGDAAYGTVAKAVNPPPPAAANTKTPLNLGPLFTPNPAGQAPPAKAAPTTNVQEEIQALNATLPVFGLSKEEIQEIDRLATQIQNFNPAAYTDLINKFVAQAQQPAQQNNANAATTGAGNNKSNAGTTSNVGPFQV